MKMSKSARLESVNLCLIEARKTKRESQNEKKGLTSKQFRKTRCGAELVPIPDTLQPEFSACIPLEDIKAKRRRSCLSELRRAVKLKGSLVIWSSGQWRRKSELGCIS